MKPFKKFNKIFQIRWKEPMGFPECPYLYRWTLVVFGFTIRLHHWLRSDDCRYFHDHASDFVSIVLRGNYWNVRPANPDDTPTIPDKYVHHNGEVHASKCRDEDINVFTAADFEKGKDCYFRNEVFYSVEGLFNSWQTFTKPKKSIWFSKAKDRHWLSIPKGGAWTLLLCGRPYHKWGFWVTHSKTGELVKWRPLRYFHKYGIIQTKDYQ